MQRRRVLALLGGLAGALTLGAVIPWRRNRYYAGPPSDHFDGTTFFNAGADPPRGLLDLLRWQLFADDTDWPARYPSPADDTPPARVDGNRLRVSFVGHASFLLQTGGLNILIDPVWSERASPFSFAGPRRVNAPGIAFDALPPIDVVLISHNHYDHLDVQTLTRLVARHAPRIVVPLGNDTIVAAAVAGADVIAADWGDTVTLGPSVGVRLEPTLHWSARSMFDRRHALWASFVLSTPAGAVYAIGDSGLGDGRIFREIAARHPDILLALLPIGAYEPRWFMREQHFNPDDAVRAFGWCGARYAIAHHWGTFKLTNEGIEAPLDALGVALAHHRVDPARFQVLRPGQVWTPPAPQ